jgi:signal transduction histidine kinase
MENWNRPETIALWLIIILILFTFLTISMVYIVKVYLKRIYTEREKAQKLKLEYKSALIHDSVVIQEKERERIAADLHDSLISKLNSVKYMMYSTDEISVIELSQKIDESIKLTRHISHDLCPPLIDESSLIEIIEELTLEFPVGTDTLFTYSGIEYNNITKDSKLQISRVAQEIFNNIQKHSGANVVSTHIHFGYRYFVLYITDNGIGYDTESISKGLGHKNIILRSEYLKAKTFFKSEKGVGSRYIILINSPADSLCINNVMTANSEQKLIHEEQNV